MPEKLPIDSSFSVCLWNGSRGPVGCGDRLTCPCTAFFRPEDVRFFRTTLQITTMFWVYLVLLHLSLYITENRLECPSLLYRDSLCTLSTLLSRFISSRPRPLARGGTRCATGASLLINLVLVALQLRVDGALGEGRDGRRSGGSGWLAAGPSPPVHGPCACTRARSAAAIWRHAMRARSVVDGCTVLATFARIVMLAVMVSGE